MVLLRSVLQIAALIAPLYSGAIAAPEVGEDGTFEAILSEGKAKGLVGRSAVDPGLLLFDKRQQCLTGYGTCPGGNACSCPTSGANCCGSICKYLAQTCCQGYICDSGEGCCGGANSNRCYPVSQGAQCCFDGRYCPSGSTCVRRNGESSARCQYSNGSGGGGGSDEGDTTSVRTSSTSSRSYTATTTYTGSSGGGSVSYRIYTITFTVYYYVYEIYSTTIRGATTSVLMSVTSDFTSTGVVLSTSATDSYAASSLLRVSASSIETSISSSNRRESSSLSSDIASSRTTSSASASQSRTTSVPDGNFNGGGTGGGASRASQLRVADGAALILGSLIVGLVGSLMVVL